MEVTLHDRPTEGPAPLEDEFDMHADEYHDSDIVTWNFDDVGSDDNRVENKELRMTHTYEQPGKYTASSWVIDE